MSFITGSKQLWKHTHSMICTTYIHVNRRLSDKSIYTPLTLKLCHQLVLQQRKKAARHCIKDTGEWYVDQICQLPKLESILII